MKKRILSFFLALVLTSTIGVFPAAAEEERESSDPNPFVILEPVGGTVTRAEIEDAIVEQILSEPMLKERDEIQCGPLTVDAVRHVTLAPQLWFTTPEGDTVSLTFPIELARFSTCIGSQSGEVVACGGKSTRLVPVKQIEGWKTPVVLFAGDIPVIVLGGTGQEVTVSYGTESLNPVTLNEDIMIMIGNDKMSLLYINTLKAVRQISKTELVTTTLTGRDATPQERGAFTQAYSVTLSFTDGAGNDLGAAFKGARLFENCLLVFLPFDATLIRFPGETSSLPLMAIEEGDFAPLFGCGTYVFGRWDSPFGDVKEQDWYFSAVFDAVDRGRMAGTSATRFLPDGFVTREMLLTTLWRMAGKPGDDTNILSYADVSEISEYAIGAFQWALEKKIINPAGDRLNPKGMVTREMLATILKNYATTRGEGSSGEITGSLEYPDSDEISLWAVEGVKFVTSKGWMNGYLGGMFNPQGLCTRAELANVLAMF